MQNKLKTKYVGIGILEKAKIVVLRNLSLRVVVQKYLHTHFSFYTNTQVLYFYNTITRDKNVNVTLRLRERKFHI